jgi:hypothetical protein
MLITGTCSSFILNLMLPPFGTVIVPLTMIIGARHRSQ